MVVRIEVGAERVDRPNPALSENVEDLFVDPLDATPIGARSLVASLGLKRALEVIHQRQQLSDETCRRRVGEGLTFPLGSLAEVVEFGRFPYEQIVILVTLLLGLFERSYGIRRHVLFFSRVFRRLGARLGVRCLFVHVTTWLQPSC